MSNDYLSYEPLLRKEEMQSKGAKQRGRNQELRRRMAQERKRPDRYGAPGPQLCMRQGSAKMPRRRHNRKAQRGESDNSRLQEGKEFSNNSASKKPDSATYKKGRVDADL